MYDVWNLRRKKYEQARESIQALIELNYEDIEETVIEFLDEARTIEDISVTLVELRTQRNRLFEVQEQIEESVDWYTNLMNKVRDIEYPNGLPEEDQE